MSRRDFNRVQFGDRAELAFDFPRVHVVDVHEGAQGDAEQWDNELGTIDFSETYGDRGIPIE